MSEQNVPAPDTPETALPEAGASDVQEIPAEDIFTEVMNTIPVADEPYKNVGEAQEMLPEEDDLPETPSDGTTAFSLLAGVVGCFVGTILCAAGGGMTSTLGMLLFLLIPLAIGAANLLFKGSRRIPGLVITALFTALGVWIVPSFTAAAADIKAQRLSFFSLPLIAVTKIGKASYFTDFAFDTAHVFPFLFAVVGVLIVWELYKMKKN